MAQHQYNTYSSDDIKLTDVIRAFQNYASYVIRKFWVVLLGAIIMGAAGYAFATLSKTKYQANASFNVVDSKGMGGLGGLLGNFGIGFGGATSNELLSGIIQSRLAIKSAFLSTVTYKGREEKLIHVLFEDYGMYEDWEGDPVMENYRFEANNIDELTRKEDSILNVFYTAFIEDFLDVEYEILQGLIITSVKTYSYDFSKGMLEHMLAYSSDFFINKQIENKINSVEVAQYKVDSLEAALEGKRYQLAKLQDQSKYLQKAEGAVAMNRLAAEISSLSIRVATSRDALEVSKTSLLQETPVINVIDHPAYSTDIKKKKWKVWTLIGVIVGSVLSIIGLMFNKAAIDGFEREMMEESLQESA